MADSTMAIKSALWAFLALAFVSWVLSLIGIAGLQRQCHFQQESTLFQVGGDRGLNSSYDCSRKFSYYWFMIALELVSLLGVAILSCMRLLAASGLSWLGWFTVLTVLFTQGSDTFLAVKDVTGGTGHFYDYARLAAAGWVLTTVANFAIIFILGWRPRRVAANSGFGK